jgi:hypothetical protein
MLIGDLLTDAVDANLASCHEFGDLVSELVPINLDRHRPVAEHLDHSDLDRA